MTDFIIRDMVSGALVGSVIKNSPFSWAGGKGECRTTLAAGLELSDERGRIIQRVYAIEDQPSGEGSEITYGAPTYDEANDKVVRSVAKAQTQKEIDYAAKAWVRNRREAYKKTILAGKGYAEFGDLYDGIGFVLDTVISELAARGAPATPEFADLVSKIAQVKAGHPKP